MSKLVSEAVYQTISMAFPSARKDDGAIRLTFALDVKDGVAVGMSGGGIWKGNDYIGSFYGLVGFQHNVIGEDAATVDAVLADLSAALEESYGVPSLPAVEEPELETLEGGEAE